MSWLREKPLRLWIGRIALPLLIVFLAQLLFEFFVLRIGPTLLTRGLVFPAAYAFCYFLGLSASASGSRMSFIIASNAAAVSFIVAFLVATIAGVIAGVSLGILLIPALIGGGMAVGYTMYAVQGYFFGYRADTRAQWRRLHCLRTGLIIAPVVFGASMLSIGADDRSAASLVIQLLLIAFIWSATLAHLIPAGRIVLREARQADELPKASRPRKALHAFGSAVFVVLCLVYVGHAVKAYKQEHALARSEQTSPVAVGNRG